MKNKCIKWVPIVYFILVTGGCKFHSITDFVSPDLRERAIPADISKELESKYKFGNIVIIPSIRHGKETDDYYHIRIDVFSPQSLLYLKIVNAQVAVDGKNTGIKQLFDNNLQCQSNWDEPLGYYYCHVQSNKFQIERPSKVKSVSLKLQNKLSTSEREDISTEATYTFTPKVRKYFE
ncbi:hypothetical protein [Desulfopila sp. IMCC35008]|uniref:hypothetical protein n=1 Tax=Desulfopila sp. IMCC35008 TaxID=2653858 RepID=UPI0013D7E477|nr:hypothetical protein [Desulfopila sp. IMCC35008]